MFPPPPLMASLWLSDGLLRFAQMSLLVFGCQDKAPDEQDVVASGRSS